MFKRICGFAVLASCLALSATASADHAIVVVEDPTPNRFFSGTYVISNDDPATEENEYREGTQDGHIAVYENGVVACNGNGSYETWDQNGDGKKDGVPGYLWVGPELAATGDILIVAGHEAQTPGGEAGLGSNHGKYRGEPTGKSPCPEADPEGDGPGR